MNFSAINAAAINASAEQIWKGSGNIVIDMAVLGNELMTSSARGVAVIDLDPVVAENVAALGRGNADITFTASGVISNVVFGFGNADIELNGYARTYQAVKGMADVLIEFGGSYGIPNSLPAPTLYSDAPNARRIFPDADIRIVQVPADQSLLVRPGRRSQNIQREGRQS